MSKQQYPAIAVVLQDIGDAILNGKAANGDPMMLAETHSGIFATYLRGVQFSGRAIGPVDSFALDALDALTGIATNPKREMFYVLAAAGILGAAHMLMIEEAMKQREEAAKAAQEPPHVWPQCTNCGTNVQSDGACPLCNPAPQAPQEPAEAEGYTAEDGAPKGPGWRHTCPLCGTQEGNLCPSVAAGLPECPGAALERVQRERKEYDWNAGGPSDMLLDKAHATPAERESFRADMGRLEKGKLALPDYVITPGYAIPANLVPGMLVYLPGEHNRALVGYIGSQGGFVDMKASMSKPNYIETVKKLAETERELAELYDGLNGA